MGCDSPKLHDHIGNRALVFLQVPPAGTGLALAPLDFVLAGFELADFAAKLSDSEIVLAGSDPLVETDAELCLTCPHGRTCRICDRCICCCTCRD